MFNQASKKLSDFFYKIEEKIQKPIMDLEDSIIQINDKIIIWMEDKNYDDVEFIDYIKLNYKTSYMIYNILPEKINTYLDPDKILDFQIPNNPSYSLEFIISFCISAENWLNLDKSHKIIIHDDAHRNEGKVFLLISTLLSYSNKKKQAEIINSYADLITNMTGYKYFKEIDIMKTMKNNLRYLNYFTCIQNSPLINLKKIFIDTIIISGAPAIDNTENTNTGPYVTINKNSFYSPVIRIKSNNAYVYSSFTKNGTVSKRFYSKDDVVKFNINKMLFNDVIVEVLHKTETSFKLLFSIQFNTFFCDNNYSMKFSKDQIDSVDKDIRYPQEFFIDFIFDTEKEEKLSPFDEYSITWKTLLSEFISKGLSDKNTSKDNKIKKEEVKVSSTKEEKNDEDKKDKKGDEKKEEEKRKENIENDAVLNKEEELINMSTTNTTNTVNQVNDLLKKIEKDIDITKNSNDKELEEEEDEDVENYLKNLENK